MNRNTASKADILLEQHNIRQDVEQFRRVVIGMESAMANASPQLKELVRKLYDQGWEKQANALAKEFEGIVNHTQKLSQLGSLLSRGKLQGLIS
jgi:hypothetical protein